MNKKKIKEYCLTLPQAKEDYPFGPDVLVFKIKNKLFALMTTREGVERVNLKCDPEEAIILREIFEDVIPGYHMNKAHWNTIILSGSIPDGEIKRMIDRSYCLVVKKLKKLDRESLEIKYGHKKVFKSTSSPWV
ncbi:MAG: MmcQ/YjbR family DNA-binding protein [Pseudomonadota bacterium]|nr:MmcQ/YjbR family DNA-binding protein [Pseudomonadota bacterium]